MRATVRFLGLFRSLAGVGSAVVELEDGSDLGSALEKLAADFPAFTGPSVFAGGLVLVDGTESRNLDGARTHLSEDSTLTLIPVVHGG